MRNKVAAHRKDDVDGKVFRYGNSDGFKQKIYSRVTFFARLSVIKIVRICKNFLKLVGDYQQVFALIGIFGIKSVSFIKVNDRRKTVVKF